MPTPRAGYYLRDGTRVPGTTTIIGRFKDSGALMQWAFRQGKEGKSRLYEEAEKAADIGTAVHSMVELHTKGASETECLDVLATLPEEGHEKAKSGFSAYLAWAKNFNIEIIEREVQLVSEKHRFGGTPDAIGRINNGLVLLDYKTSNGVYSDMLIQLAAYKNLWEENRPDLPITGGCHLLRFAKEHGDFGHYHFQDLNDEWAQFLLFRQSYELDKIIKKRAA